MEQHLVTHENLRSVLASMAGVFDGDEPVDELSHALQSANFAYRAGADSELLVAALFHDVARSPLIPSFEPHEIVGARWLRPRFGERVAWLVGAHTAAKIYLMDTEPGYWDLLSRESKKSAQLQRLVPLDGFESHAWWSDALRLRRWDDAAKEAADAELPDIDDLVTLVEALQLR